MGHGPDEGKRGPLGLLILWTLVVVVPLTLWFAPLGIDPKMQKALAITAFMIGSWITHWQDVAISGLMGLYLFWATGVVGFGDGVSRVCHHHALVSVRRHPVRPDGDQIGACAPARVHDHARHRSHLPATAARDRRRRLPADVHRPVRHRPRRHHVRRRHGPRRVLRLWPRQPDRQGHVHPPRVHGDDLRQDDHRRRGIDHRPRPDRTRRRGPRSLEPVVPRLSALRHPDDLHCLAAGAVDVSPRAGGAARRRGVPAR